MRYEYIVSFVLETEDETDPFEKKPSQHFADFMMDEIDSGNWEVMEVKETHRDPKVPGWSPEELQECRGWIIGKYGYSSGFSEYLLDAVNSVKNGTANNSELGIVNDIRKALKTMKPNGEQS